MECQDTIFIETFFQLCFTLLFYSHVLESCLLSILLRVTVCIVFSPTSKVASSFMEYEEKKCKKGSLQQMVHKQPFLFSTRYGTIQYLLLMEIADTRTVSGASCVLSYAVTIDMVVNLDYKVFSFSIINFCLIITFMSDVFFC